MSLVRIHQGGHAVHPSPEEHALDARAAFDRVAPEFESLADDQLVGVTVDVPNCARMVHAHLRRLGTLREGIIASTRGFDIARFDKLRDYLLALEYAHDRFANAGSRMSAMPGLYDQAIESRAALVAEARDLAGRGLLSTARVERLGSGTGYRSVAYELLALVDLFREEWATLEGETRLCPEELEGMGELADDILEAVEEREHMSVTLAIAGRDRRRAFTLFSRAYNDARRATMFLRWFTGDADTYAPSLHSRRASTNGHRFDRVEPRRSHTSPRDADEPQAGAA